MKVGFTGTRTGLSVVQIVELSKFLDHPSYTEFHHGDCIGADEMAHDIAKHALLRIVIHPPENDRLRAFCKVSEHGHIHIPRDYLERNHKIVDDTELLVACPAQMREEKRSGTWATVRYARSQGKKVIILWPREQEEK